MAVISEHRNGQKTKDSRDEIQETHSRTGLLDYRRN